MKKVIAVLMILCLTGSVATAETISFSGTVEASMTKEIYAPVGGTVEEVPVQAGQKVSADTVIARIRTRKVYAEEDGTITAVYGIPGDDAETITKKYGAVMYLEGNTVYTISATADKDSSDRDKEGLHSGQTVYIQSRSNSANRGEAQVTTVNDSSFTVLVSSGTYEAGDSCIIYRSSNYSGSSRIGQGTISRMAPTAINGTGSIVRYAVQAGDSVTRGQLLFETVEGGFDGLEMTGTEIRAEMDGTLASLNVKQGGTVTKDSVVAVIYPKDAIWVAANVAETDLQDLQIGQKVKVELDWNLDLGVSYEGRVEMISALGTIGERSTTYPVYISFTPDENTRYGMTALVSTIDEKAEITEPETEEPAPGTEESAEETENGEATESAQSRKPDREWPFSGEGMPENLENMPSPPEGFPTDGSFGSGRPENMPSREELPESQEETKQEKQENLSGNE